MDKGCSPALARRPSLVRVVQRDPNQRRTDPHRQFAPHLHPGPHRQSFHGHAAPALPQDDPPVDFDPQVEVALVFVVFFDDADPPPKSPPKSPMCVRSTARFVWFGLVLVCFRRLRSDVCTSERQ